MNRPLILSVLCLGAVLRIRAAEAASSPAEELQQLRVQIVQQREQIQKLQQAIDGQQKIIDRVLSSTPALNAAVMKTKTPDREQRMKPPLAVAIGNTTVTPLGFVDASLFGRSTNVGSGIGTNFGSIPYNTSPTGHLSELNFSTQNSRLGFRVDSNFRGVKLLGYFEADFLGNQPGNVFVSSNSDTFRMRNVFVDIRKNKFEVLAGQDWSMAVPNRRGISPLPADIFYSQDMDTNYQAGLVWSRQTQFRFVAHPNENFALGLSLENPEQYLGGSSGGGSVVLPTAFLSTAGAQFNNGSSNYAAANLHPDIIFKGAYDWHPGGKAMHLEAVGLVRTFKFAYGAAKPVVYQASSATAASGEVNANLEVAKGFSLIANTFFGSGNGRYVFGQAPDAIIRADGSISPVHTYSTVDGFEAKAAKSTLIYGYYGGIYVRRNAALDANGTTPIGYGFAGSPNFQNRSIQEGTFGVVQTLWKNEGYGSLALITQYSYLTRNPWYVAAGSPKNARTNMYWVNLRYSLP